MDRRVQKLLNWYRRHARPLPWRQTRDPYAIFISELMLQQTQVDRVLPKYESFLKQFPTWKTLANASTADLIHAWAGLGYNRRVLYAREAAREVITTGLPDSVDTWRRLKGVGPYMAAALTEFVNHTRAVVIDTNVRRVAGRIWLGIPFPSLQDDQRILRHLERAIPLRGAHWNIPQAFMDLGSSICSISKPDCLKCPLRQECKAANKFIRGQASKHRRIHRPTERIHAEKKYPDRIYRGRILSLIRTQTTVDERHLGSSIDPTFDHITDQDWLHAMIERLMKDGLLVRKHRYILSLPQS